MALNNRLWCAERIRGELLKLGTHVSKRTIQKYIRLGRVRPSSQTWSTFLRNHAHEIWACDFLPVTDLFFRSLFARVASSSGTTVLKTPYHAPRANACCERFLGSVRRECLDHLLILHEQQLSRVLLAYVSYFNRARPHQGLQQQIPDPLASALRDEAKDGPLLALPILGGLHHEYRRVA
jgi:putative transposase